MEPDQDGTPVETRPALIFDGAGWRRAEAALVAETPIALVYNGISHAVMMATPSDIEDFALGFSLSEGIVARADEVLDLEIVTVSAGIEARVTLTARRFAGLKERRRTLAGATGCGLCGVESLDQAIRPREALPAAGHQVEARLLLDGLAALDSRQDLRRRTRASHGAAFLAATGETLAREDVGRHNALDKLIGGIARAKLDFTQGVAVISSRCSVEMVQKAASVGIPVLAAVAAPTALAVRSAELWGVTLVAQLRQGGFTIYAHPERIAGIPT
jgi:FdhD protein